MVVKTAPRGREILYNSFVLTNINIRNRQTYSTKLPN